MTRMIDATTRKMGVFRGNQVSEKKCRKRLHFFECCINVLRIKGVVPVVEKPGREFRQDDESDSEGMLNRILVATLKTNNVRGRFWFDCEVRYLVTRIAWTWAIR